MSDNVTVVDQPTQVIVDSNGNVTVVAVAAQGPAGTGLPAGGTAGQVVAIATASPQTFTYKTLAKGDVGLDQVDNTSDVNKPISSATQTALNGKLNTTATTANVPDSTDRRYVTDAQRTVIQNTSGTNTGDQDLSGLAPLASPALTGAPTAPTAAGGTNTTQLATTGFVQQEITTNATPDATTSIKGKVQLTGDLDGTATNPKVKSRIVTATIGLTTGDFKINTTYGGDVRAAIQAAFDAYTATGANIVLMDSVTLNGSVHPRSNIFFSQREGTTITFNSGWPAAVNNGGFHAFETDSLITNFGFEEMNFSGTATGTGLDGYEFQSIYIRHGSNNFYVRKIKGTQLASAMVRMRDAAYNFDVQDISVETADSALLITVDCHDFRVRNVRALNTFAEGVYLGSNVYDFILDNIHSDGAGTRGLSINNDYTPLTRAGYRANISNVTTLNSTLEGVYLVGCDELNLSNVYSRGNKRDGVIINGCNNITLVSAQAWNNNQQRATDGTSQYAGIRMYDSKRIAIITPNCNDDGATTYQYRGIDSQQSVAGATDYIRLIGGRVENTVSSSQVVLIGNNSTATNVGGYNPERFNDNGNVSATPQVLLKNGDFQRLILTQNTTLQTLDTNAVPGQQLRLLIVQNSTGGWSFTFPSNVTLINGAWTPDTSANKAASITLEFQSSGTGWFEIARSDNSLASGLATKQPLDATLTALAAYSANGIVTQTAADTFTGRAITGTTNQVTVTNGDGVSGNPTLSLPQDIATTSTPSFAKVVVGTSNIAWNALAEYIGTASTGNLDIVARGDIHNYIDSNNNGTNEWALYSNGSTNKVASISEAGKLACIGINIGASSPPAAATSTGTAGDIAYDTSFIYVCTATNTWKRASLSSW